MYTTEVGDGQTKGKKHAAHLENSEGTVSLKPLKSH
jgi:hypothetical protein